MDLHELENYIELWTVKILIERTINRQPYITRVSYNVARL